MVRISCPPAMVVMLVVVKMLVVSGLILSLKVAIWRKQFS